MANAEADWEIIARAEIQPVRLAILDVMMSEPPDGDPGWSAKTVASRLGLSLAAASHHVRSLRDKGLVAQVGRKRQVRGAVQTFYGLSEKALPNSASRKE
jgi:DNA-binding transcriptional ArsR family regulator